MKYSIDFYKLREALKDIQMISYFSIPPKFTISRYVRSFWVLEGTVTDSEPYIHRTMADGSAELFFHYKGVFDELLPDDRAEKSILSGVSGPSQYFNRFSIGENFAMFGVYLYPFALPKIFKIPASAFSNEMVELDSLLRQEGNDLTERMMLAADTSSRVSIVTDFIEKRIASDHFADRPVLESVNCLIREKGAIRIDELAKRYFLSSRQFERKFKEFSGFSPKLYSRIIRFQAAAAQYGHHTRTLTEIAYDCGYYDQSHFISDFKEFSGYHPKKYFSGHPEGVEWRSC